MKKLIVAGLLVSVIPSFAMAGDRDYFETTVDTCYLFPEINTDNITNIPGDRQTESFNYDYNYRIKSKLKLFTHDSKGDLTVQDYDKVQFEKQYFRANNVKSVKDQVEIYVRARKDMRCKN